MRFDQIRFSIGRILTRAQIAHWMSWMTLTFVKGVIIIGLIIIVGLLSSPAKAEDPSTSDATCTGNFVNPIGDICWDCMLPLTLGSIEVWPSDLPDFGNPGSPICACANPIPRIGLAIGLWEPVRLADATRKEWCFPNLGGLKIDPGIGFQDKTYASPQTGNHSGAWHVHWYVYPVMALLELVTDIVCLEATSFDLAYVTELDPLWQDDTLSLIIHPEAALFTSLPAQAACTADCALATVTNPSPQLFWCMGCNGSSYPYNGNVSHEITPAQSGLLAAERMAFKLHRQLVAWQTSTPAAMCQKNPQPMMDKRQYRWQMTNPKPHTKGPFVCPRTGGPTVTYENFKMRPVVGEDFGWLVFRKRNCCAL